jgi:Endonuclease-reverse transcriptase
MPRPSFTSVCSPILRSIDGLSSPSGMAIDFTFISAPSFHLYNFYHSVPDHSHGLHSLLSSSLDNTVPTLVVGDFNTHSAMWSPPGHALSSWGPLLEEWMTSQDLACLNPLGTPTWRGPPGHEPSVLDLFLVNSLAATTLDLSPITISFDLSLHSDHAALSTTLSLHSLLPPPPTWDLPGFKVIDDMEDTWQHAFRALPATPLITSEADLLKEADRLLQDIDTVCSDFFDRHSTPDPWGARWWNQECSAALALWKHAPPPLRAPLYHALRTTITQAKRDAAHDFLDHCSPDNLWKAAHWRHGRSVSLVPPLLDSDTNSLTTDPPAMASILQSRFFPPIPPRKAITLPSDPLPLPTRHHGPVTLSEIRSALAPTSNKSAPGPSGIGYKLLKWAFAASPSCFVTLFSAALSLGVHPLSR